MVDQAPLRVSRRQGEDEVYITIHRRSGTSTLNMDEAIELHTALGLVLYEYPLYTFYENETYVADERARREWVAQIEERERASRAGYRIQPRTQPKGKLEDI